MAYATFVGSIGPNDEVKEWPVRFRHAMSCPFPLRSILGINTRKSSFNRVIELCVFLHIKHFKDSQMILARFSPMRGPHLLSNTRPSSSLGLQKYNETVECFTPVSGHRNRRSLCSLFPFVSTDEMGLCWCKARRLI